MKSLSLEELKTNPADIIVCLNCKRTDLSQKFIDNNGECTKCNSRALITYEAHQLVVLLNTMKKNIEAALLPNVETTKKEEVKVLESKELENGNAGNGKIS